MGFAQLAAGTYFERDGGLTEYEADIGVAMECVAEYLLTKPNAITQIRAEGIIVRLLVQFTFPQDQRCAFELSRALGRACSELSLSLVVESGNKVEDGTPFWKNS